MSRIKSFFAVFLLLAAALFLSGCMSVTAEELYQLPKASENYFRLQTAVDEIISSGAEYSPPTAGTNRQSIQLQDLNSDGTMEAVAFLSFPGSDVDKPLKMYIFRLDGEAYKVASVIEGDGSSFERVSYIDLDGDGVLEVIVGWKMSSALQMLNIYSLKDFQPTKLYSTDYSQYSLVDMDSDGIDDIVALKLSSADSPGEAELISESEDGEIITSTALLSKEIESLARTVVGKLSTGDTALFVDGVYDGNNLITDVFTCDTKIKNITIGQLTGLSSDNIRTYNVYCRDINGDGAVDVPRPRVLWSQNDTVYRAIDWYTYSSGGDATFAATTFHNYSDSWYLILPRSWGNNVTVRRVDSVSGERTIVFSYVSADREKTVDFLSIYTLTGDNKEERAKIGDRFTIRTLGSTIFAAEIYNTDTSPITIDKDGVINGFNLIYSDWKTN